MLDWLCIVSRAVLWRTEVGQGMAKSLSESSWRCSALFGAILHFGAHPLIVTSRCQVPLRRQWSIRSFIHHITI